MSIEELSISIPEILRRHEVAIKHLEANFMKAAENFGTKILKNEKLINQLQETINSHAKLIEDLNNAFSLIQG